MFASRYNSEDMSIVIVAFMTNNRPVAACMTLRALAEKASGGLICMPFERVNHWLDHSVLN